MIELTSIQWFIILGGFIIIALIKLIHNREITILGHTAQITSLITVGYSGSIGVIIIIGYLI